MDLNNKNSIRFSGSPSAVHLLSMTRSQVEQSGTELPDSGGFVLWKQYSERKAPDFPRPDPDGSRRIHAEKSEKFRPYHEL